MKTTQMIRKQAQAGFTLIELIVVIVILGILAATALPRMFDMSGQARLAKMQAALGAVKAASSSGHAQWLVNGGQLACASCSGSGGIQAGTGVKAEGEDIIMLGGYPDVGGDGLKDTSVDVALSGIAKAANLLATDYLLSTANPTVTPATATSAKHFSVAADAAHPKCRFTYVEAVQTDAGAAQPTVKPPEFKVAELIIENCG